MKYQLQDEKTGRVIANGDRAKTFRGEAVTVRGFTPPHHAGSTGRVHVTYPGGAYPGAGATREFFPGVIGAKIVEVE